MDALTAIRFAKPGFTPAKRTKIRNDHWYLVTLQNVETDARCDYVGLGKGEYTVLAPGQKARSYRDAKLNHCNRIEQYNGSVFEVIDVTHGRRVPGSVYYCSQVDVDTHLVALKAEESEWRAKVREEKEKHFLRVNLPGQEWRKSAITDCDRALALGEWFIEVSQIR